MAMRTVSTCMDVNRKNCVVCGGDWRRTKLVLVMDSTIVLRRRMKLQFPRERRIELHHQQGSVSKEWLSCARVYISF